MGHEEAFVKAFIASAQQARWVHFLALPKRRQEILSRLNRHLPYISELGTEVPSDQDYPGGIEQLLRSKGAGPTCHVLVDGLRADGRELPLAQALNEICMHRAGAILSCLPGRLAYYKPESPAPGVLLERP